MSNVLIGIIGVILFIGLALAGALFLGPRFQESRNNSRASAVLQSLQQVSNAANLYKTNTGAILYEGDRDLLTSGGYLKSYPDNPIIGPISDRRLQIKLSNGIDDAKEAIDGAEAKYAIARIYYEGDADKVAICKAISQQTGGSSTLGGVDGNRTAGCGYEGVTLYAWVRI